VIRSAARAPISSKPVWWTRMSNRIFLGSSYEGLFDRFEFSYALVYADIAHHDVGHVWGPRAALHGSPMEAGRTQ